VIPFRLSQPDRRSLAATFFETPDALGRFDPVGSADLTQPYRQLLAHNAHMTVTLEAYHGCPARLEVLDVTQDATSYARRMVLRRACDGQLVMAGIVRLHLPHLDPAVREPIVTQQAPLGRILIEHNVLRRVVLAALWEIEPSTQLCQWCELAAPRTMYGRTAVIHCDEQPTIELLEMVPPASSQP